MPGIASIMNTPKQTVSDLLELINSYPSPHNGQPVKLLQVSDTVFELYFDKERGLQSSDISFIFSFVSMGVFIEHLQLCGRALGHKITITEVLPKVQELHGAGQVKFAECRIEWDVLEINQQDLDAIHFRRTSRKKYYQGITPALSDNIIKTASAHGMTLVQLPKQQGKQAIWLNQRAVFDDMFDEPVRQELDHWLRYTQAQKQSKKDGLAYDCMELNGHVLKYIVGHPRILRLPVISWIIKQYYLHTMKDASDVFYMMAPFQTKEDALQVGKVIMKIWMSISAEGYYLHPFGTIMSNHAAHQDFLKLAGEMHESRITAYLSFIFRAGKSDTPVSSLRIPIKEHLVRGVAP
jgi:hypothetical protein